MEDFSSDQQISVLETVCKHPSNIFSNHPITDFIKIWEVKRAADPSSCVCCDAAMVDGTLFSSQLFLA